MLHRALQTGYLHQHFRGLLCVTDMLVQRAHFFLQSGSAPVRKQKSPCEVARSPGSSTTPQPLEGCRRQVVSKEGCLKGGPGRRGISLWGETGDPTVRVETLPQFADKCPGVGFYIMMPSKVCPSNTPCCGVFLSCSISPREEGWEAQQWLCHRESGLMCWCHS